jgi:hypothetical protein
MPFSYRNTIEAYQSLKEFATRRFPRALSTFEKSSLHRAGRWSAKVRCRSGGLAEEKDCDRATSVLLDARKLTALRHNIPIPRRSFCIRLNTGPIPQAGIRCRFGSRGINIKQSSVLPTELVFDCLPQIDEQVEAIRDLLRLRGSSLRGPGI